MSGPLDPQNAFWQEVFKEANARRAWNAALWEVTKLIDTPTTLETQDILDAIKTMIKE